jgi:DNA (cytosine-5)-methyltransferase 1
MAKMEGIKPPRPRRPLRVCELFAGVGGFHLGLSAAGMKVVWANQWEPGTRTQHAYDCYERHFPGLCVNDDIGAVIDRYQKGTLGSSIPEHDVLVGGFPCQDYSVAKPLSMAEGIQGHKGVLWWQIERWLKHFRPGFLLLENVDRLLKSPTSQRGRDFAVMLTCLSMLDYVVEWRVINAADYGYPQKRRRVFIVGRHRSLVTAPRTSPHDWILSEGILAKACPVRLRRPNILPELEHEDGAFWLDRKEALDPFRVTREFGKGLRHSPFLNSGFMRDGRVWTLDVEGVHSGPRVRLKDVLQPEREVAAGYWVKGSALAKWRYLKGAKAERRVHPRTGFEYFYTEGGIPFPDRIDGPSRTILTGEGGTSPSRFKHIVEPKGDGRFRRLTPVELERLNGFPDDWTEGMPDGRRSFCMGNALVVGLVERIGRELAARVPKRAKRRVARSL